MYYLCVLIYVLYMHFVFLNVFRVTTMHKIINRIPIWLNIKYIANSNMIIFLIKEKTIVIRKICVLFSIFIDKLLHLLMDVFLILFYCFFLRVRVRNKHDRLTVKRLYIAYKVYCLIKIACVSYLTFVFVNSLD